MKRCALLLVNGRHVIREYDARQTTAKLIADEIHAAILGDFETRSEAESAKQRDTERTKVDTWGVRGQPPNSPKS